MLGPSETPSDDERQRQNIQRDQGYGAGDQANGQAPLNPEDQPGYERVFIANLPFSYTEQDVREFLSKFGSVDKIYMVPHHESRQFKGQVKVSFTGVSDIDKLIADIKATRINGTELRVERAYTKEETNRLKQQFKDRSRRQEYERRAEYEDRYYRSSRDSRDSYYDRYPSRYDDRYYDREPPRRDDYYYSRDDDRYRRRDEYSRRDDYYYPSREDDRYRRRDDYLRDSRY